MSIYKVGDDVLVKGTVCGIDASDDKCSVRVNISEHGQRYWFAEENVMPDMSNIETISQEEVMKSAYEQGLNDAWELAKTLYYAGNITTKELREIYDLEESVRSGFGMILRRYTPQEAFARLKAYEESQEIKVGDVVIYGYSEVLVTNIHKQHFDGVQLSEDNEQGDFGDSYTDSPLKNCKKTGKHINIQQILKQIGE